MPSNLQIISVSLFKMDIETSDIEKVDIGEDRNDLSDYLRELLGELSSGDNKRSFEFSRNTTEVYTCLESISKNHDSLLGDSGKAVASRLLNVEVETDKKYGHLSKNNKGTHVNKGSFIQFLYKEDSVSKYLGVKVEHQEFIDEKNFKKLLGLGVDNKIYKAFRTVFNNNTPSNVDVYDSQKKIAKYWWYDFLELSEIRTDSFNTKEACKETIRKINKIKRLDSNDYRELRNAVIVAFKQQGSMNYIEFVVDVIESYTSENDEVNKAIKSISSELKKLPRNNKFDNVFDLDPSSVPYRKRNYNLAEGITLSIDEALDDSDSKIWSEQTSSGEKLVVIKSAEGYENFTKKERTL